MAYPWPYGCGSSRTDDRPRIGHPKRDRSKIKAGRKAARRH